MKLYKLKNSSILLFAVILFVSCKNEEKEKSSRVANLPFYKDASFTPYWLDVDSEELKTFHKIPDYKLVNQNNETITQETFKDKIYVTDFFFTTCPGICPKMTANMSALQDAFKEDDDVLLLSHSVTPKIDSVATLKDYAIAQNIDGKKWHLVTGERKTIYDLGRQAYFVEEDLGEEKTDEDFLHTENFVLIDKNKHIRGIYNGLNKASIAQLIIDVRALKEEG